MSNETKNIIKLILTPKLLIRVIVMGFRGYLIETGWINSYLKKIPMDKNGLPLPWVTYSFIDFISDRLNKSMTIFEYGSGNSTLWYASKVKLVSSVEHDKNWFLRIKNNLPNNVKFFYKELEENGDYAKFSSTLDMKFDIIIVDGRDRVNCVKYAINSLNDTGIIVLDDSEREFYKSGIDFLLDKGFKKIDFWGISPGLFYKKNTTIFYKSSNCLDI
ncbi:MAG: hypothetical protein KAI79_12430 [Bacteroidales bacterium]|nr:hypothetical protein [Bacteroidales bacterium]